MFNTLRQNNLPRALRLLTLALILVACGPSGAEEQAPSNAELDSALEAYTPSTSANGIVVPVRYATLSVAWSGAVEEILVEENDQVSEGQLLVSLSGGAKLEASLASAELELIAAEQALQDLYDYAALAEANARDILEDAERDYNNIVTPAEDVDIDQAFANMILAEEALDKAQEDFDEHAHKPEDNLVRATFQSKLSQAQNAYDDAVRIYNAYSTPGNDTEIAIKKAELDLAQLAYDKAKDGPDPDDLALAQARVDNARAQVNAAQATLEDLRIVAPFAGSIGQVLVHESEWVGPGQPAVAVGDFSAFQVITTDLNEVDVANIAVGTQATVTFDAIPGVSVAAEVVQIASKSTPGEGVNYEVTLDLLERPEGLLWDMTALVEFQASD